VCDDRPVKFVTEAKVPIIKISKYNHQVCCYSRIPLTAEVHYNECQGNGAGKDAHQEQTFTILMGRMSATDQKQWAKERPTWTQGEVSVVVEKFRTRSGWAHPTLGQQNHMGLDQGVQQAWPGK
jgi:hypothetical protein